MHHSIRCLSTVSTVMAMALLIVSFSACSSHSTIANQPTPTPIVIPTPTPPVPTPTPIVLNTRVCDSYSCLAAKDWASSIDATINHRDVGYEYLILIHGQVVVRKLFGLAHTDADPPALAFTPDIQINIASVSKTLTGVAALKLLAAKHISVDAPMYPYLPKSWALGPNIRTITFRELLQHRSGLRSTADLATGYDDLEALIARGINLSDKVYHYQNQNFALFRILIPYINGFQDGSVSDIGIATARAYLDYMNSVYGQYFTVSCTPGFSGVPYVLAYSYPAGNNPGTDWGNWTPICGGGGLQLSLNDLGTFLTKLNQGAFLSGYQLQQMYYSLLGWDYEFTNTSHGICFAKNGALFRNNDRYTTNLFTLIVYCPSLDLGFVGIANSRLGSATTAHFGFPGGWDDIVQSAYTMAWH